MALRARTVKERTTARAPLNIFLVGDLGAGKATQSVLLKKEFGLYEVDMGVEQEKQRRADPALDLIFRKTVDKGKLNPTKIYRLLLKNCIERVPVSQGILFDGHPKMPDEVKFAARLMKSAKRTRIIAIYLSVPWKVTVARNTQRTGYLGDKRRADDTLEALKNRYKYVEASIKKARPVYKSLYPFAVVSGLGTVEEVHERVLKTINRLEKTLDSN